MSRCAASRPSRSRPPRSRRRRARAAPRGGRRRGSGTCTAPTTCAGMMFAATPPSVTMPCTWSPGWQLLAQQADRDLGDGHRVGGVDARPRRRRGVRLVARVDRRRSGRRRGTSPRAGPTGQGCTIIAASRPSNAPPSSISDLAAAALLGGRAEHHDGRADLVGDAREADRPRRRELAAITLWPHACPTSGSASYSAHRSRSRTGPAPVGRDERRVEAADVALRRRSRRRRATSVSTSTAWAPRRPSRGARGGRG